MRLHISLAALLVACLACFEYREARVSAEKNVNMAPMIDKRFVSPPPSAFLKFIPMARNCKAIEFKIPPIKDFNQNDKLYYLWFLNGILLPPFQSVIEPQNRSDAIITMKLDRQKIEDAIGRSPLEPSFFETSHIVEFVVSDRKYAIPGSRYSDDRDAQEDSFTWTIWFSDTPCSQ
jgi:hypothetical protein